MASLPVTRTQNTLWDALKDFWNNANSEIKLNCLAFCKEAVSNNYIGRMEKSAKSFHHKRAQEVHDVVAVEVLKRYHINSFTCACFCIKKVWKNEKDNPHFRFVAMYLVNENVFVWKKQLFLKECIK